MPISTHAQPRPQPRDGDYVVAKNGKEKVRGVVFHGQIADRKGRSWPLSACRVLRRLARRVKRRWSG